MIESILTSIKKLLGIADDDTTFDPDIIIYINTVFSDLAQLGVGPEHEFAITDESDVWATFLADDLDQARVQTYMYFRVRLMFNPPDTGPAQAAMQAQADKLEWRLNVQSESTKWVDPRPAVVLVPDDPFAD